MKTFTDLPAVSRQHKWWAGLCLLGALLFAANANAQISGAIFTNKGDGTTVNGNIYEFKADVYLNGGPPPNAPCGSAAGLPDGDYYFQVTDPSGGTLLSSDVITNRAVTVSGGVIVSAFNHAAGAGKCGGGISVQLIPYDDTPNNGGEYKVWLTHQDKYPSGAPGNKFGFSPSDSKTDNFKVREGDTTTPPEGLNEISGAKFYDTNLDGIRATDGTEPGIWGWKISIAGPSGFNSNTATDLDGDYSFPGLEAGTYGVCEIIPAEAPVWVPATATSISGITVPPDSTGNDFGNVCLGAGGGLTKGFWSNKNGQKLIDADDLCFLTAINLRNADGSPFDPVPAAACPSLTAAQISAGKTALKNWLQGANATNMSYMLSAQLAAMVLNVRQEEEGFVDGNAMVFAGAKPDGCNVPGLSSTGFISVIDLGVAANNELGVDGKAFADNSERICQEFKKNALDDANNNKNFVQSAANCTVNYNGAETCSATP